VQELGEESRVGEVIFNQESTRDQQTHAGRAFIPRQRYTRFYHSEFEGQMSASRIPQPARYAKSSRGRTRLSAPGGPGGSREVRADARHGFESATAGRQPVRKV
jgi:hypothetical protein